ncbi:hypothetical protein M9Y10_004015 [Tritrichomonas musculus]|uniref:Transmembrane protein n=1 Tax=Tritrichomonas musculus TaxID=1915356 RepID=A0ABR2JR71_9EUKA
MFSILFILSYYQLYYEKKSKSYFQNLPFLEYGFNDDSKFQINFTYVKSNMIFGLATKKEILEIDKYKNSQEYCYGHQRLSKIQFNITEPTTIQGAIRLKSALTPYAFTCEKSISIAVIFNYSNIKNNLDYRCQGALTYTMLFFIFLSALTLAFVVYIIYCFLKKIDFIDFRFIILHFFIFVTFLIQNVFTYQYYTQQKDKEYFNGRMSDKDWKASIIPKQFKIKNLSVELINSILYFLISLSLYILFYDNSSTKFVIIFSLVPVVILPTCFVLQMFNDKIVFKILTVILYVIFGSVTFSMPPILSLTKTAILIYLFESFITCSLGGLLLVATQELIGTHCLVLILTHLGMLTQAFSIGCLLLGLVYFKDFKPPTIIQSQPLLPNNSSYALLTEGETNSYNNENENEKREE